VEADGGANYYVSGSVCKRGCGGWNEDVEKRLLSRLEGIGKSKE
jgi:hypothetical protein